MKLFGAELRGWSVPPEIYRPWRSAGGGVDVDRNVAMNVSAVWACVRLLTSTVSRMPIDVLLDDATGTPRPYPAPRWLNRPILNDPNANRVAHVAQVMVSLLTDGNSFTLTPRDASNDVTELLVLDPERVEVGRASDLSPIYKVRGDKTTREYGPDEVVHLMLQPFPGMDRGISPLEAARQVFGLGVASQDYGSRFFTQDATPPVIIHVPAGTNVTAQELRENWVNHHAGADNWHQPGVLTGGAEAKTLAVNHEQAQFLQLREFQVSEIARWYGVPPHMIADVERSTSWGTGIEQQGIGFNTYTLNDYLVLIEEGYRRIVPNPRSYLRFNRSALLRSDAKTRADVHAVYLQNKVMTVDEVRALEDLPPFGGVEGGLLQTPNNNAPDSGDDSGPPSEEPDDDDQD